MEEELLLLHRKMNAPNAIEYIATLEPLYYFINIGGAIDFMGFHVNLRRVDLVSRRKYFVHCNFPIRPWRFFKNFA